MNIEVLEKRNAIIHYMTW